MDHYFIESINTEEDQEKGIADPEIEIGRCDVIENKGDQYPGNHKDDQDGDKYIFAPVEQSPVVEEPGEQAKVEEGKYIKQGRKHLTITLRHKYIAQYFYDQYKAYIINKGIVRCINPAISYYPDYYSKNDT